MSVGADGPSPRCPISMGGPPAVSFPRESRRVDRLRRASDCRDVDLPAEIFNCRHLEPPVFRVALMAVHIRWGGSTTGSVACCGVGQIEARAFPAREAISGTDAYSPLGGHFDVQDDGCLPIWIGRHLFARWRVNLRGHRPRGRRAVRLLGTAGRRIAVAISATRLATGQVLAIHWVRGLAGAASRTVCADAARCHQMRAATYVAVR